MGHNSATLLNQYYHWLRPLPQSLNLSIHILIISFATTRTILLRLLLHKQKTTKQKTKTKNEKTTTTPTTTKLPQKTQTTKLNKTKTNKKQLNPLKQNNHTCARAHEGSPVKVCNSLDNTVHTTVLH